MPTPFLLTNAEPTVKRVVCCYDQLMPVRVRRLDQLKSFPRETLLAAPCRVRRAGSGTVYDFAVSQMASVPAPSAFISHA